jgi:hypothetical protein
LRTEEQYSKLFWRVRVRRKTTGERDAAKRLGFGVVVHERSSDNKEKAVDTGRRRRKAINSSTALTGTGSTRRKSSMSEIAASGSAEERGWRTRRGLVTME